MLENIGELLRRHAPELYARTTLHRSSPEYLTQRNAFALYRERRIEEMREMAPDLYARMLLPETDKEQLHSGRAHQMYAARKKAPD